MAVLTRRRGGIDRETATAVKAFLARHTTLPVDLRRLDDDEQQELAGIIDEANADRAGANLARLDEKTRRRFEALIERAAAAPGVFEQERRADELRRRASALARRAARAGRPTADRERAFVEVVGEHLRDGYLFVEHIALLVAILGQLTTGESLAPGSSISGSGDSLTLTIDRRFGAVGAASDEDGLLARTGELLRHLAANRWLYVEEHGQTCDIKVGSRTRDILWGQS